MYLGKPQSSHQNLVEGYRPERTLWGGLWKVSLSRLCLLWALEEDLDLSRLQTCFQWRKWHEKTPGCTQSVNSIRHNHQFSCFWSDTHMYSYTTANQIRSDQSLSRVRLFATPWIAARQASLSITNSQKRGWEGCLQTYEISWQHTVGREQLARRRQSGSLAPLHSCPAAGITCGTAHTHHGVVLVSTPWNALVVEERRVEAPWVLWSCCHCHCYSQPLEQSTATFLLQTNMSAIPTAPVFLQLPCSRLAYPGSREPWETARHTLTRIITILINIPPWLNLHQNMYLVSPPSNALQP